MPVRFWGQVASCWWSSKAVLTGGILLVVKKASSDRMYSDEEEPVTHRSEERIYQVPKAAVGNVVVRFRKVKEVNVSRVE